MYFNPLCDSLTKIHKTCIMFNRLTHVSLTIFVLILALTTVNQTAATAQNANANAQFAVIQTIRTLLPKFVERYYPGGPAAETAPKTVAEKSVSVVRRARRISAAYEGYAIQVASADRPLLHDDPIFRKFGNIVYERTDDGKYAYLIQVPFSGKESVLEFLRNVIAPRVADARIAEFKSGKLNLNF